MANAKGARRDRGLATVQNVFCTFNAYFALIPEELNRAIQRTFNANAESREDAKPPRHFYTLLSVTYILIKEILDENIKEK